MAIAAGLVLAVYNMGGGETEAGGEKAAPAARQGLSPADAARVARLTARVAEEPGDVRALLGVGNVHFRAGDYATAAAWMERAVAAGPGQVRARLALGAANFNLGERGAARRHWLRAIELDPGNVEAHYDLGFLYLSRKPPDLAGARRMWRRVLRLAPGTPVAKTVAAHLKALGR